MPRKNRYLEALKEQPNLVGMASLFALSAATLNPLPLIVGVVAEAAYLLFVPDSKWYDARLSRRHDAEIVARRQRLKEQTLPLLRPAMQARFARLEETRRQIDTQSQDDKEWFRQVLRKLDYLLEKFLVFAAKEVQFRAYLSDLRAEVRGEPVRSHTEDDYDWPDELDARSRSTRTGSVRKRTLRLEDTSEPRDAGDDWVHSTVTEVQTHYERERTRLEATIGAEPDGDTRAVLEKRADVLTRRHEFAGKIGKILTNLNHQLALVEDTFGLINDEIRARSPEQILADIEEVVVATDTMSSALEELAPYTQLAESA